MRAPGSEPRAGGLVVVGAQWGDEGKGKIVDLLAATHDVVVRYGGGPNAGHTLVVGGDKLVLHLCPSGVLHPGKRCVLGEGMVIDPEKLAAELRALRARALADPTDVLISERAHLILPTHKLLDEARERGPSAIGTTKRGVGPAYEDKAARRGLRVGDLLRPDRFRARLRVNFAEVAARLGDALPDPGQVADAYLRLGDELAPMIGDAARALDRALREGRRVLFEGAQGTLLDLDHGTYPFVTSSSTIAGGACAGAGVGPSAIATVLGVTKAYTTRVGGGPFPTEMAEDEAARLRAAGGEFGATTGRPRRCGHLDAAALRLARRLNGLDYLAITKLDVLSGLGPPRICVGYRLDGRLLDEPPGDPDDLARAVPEYADLEGFDGDLSAARSLDDLPGAARRYLDRIAAEVGVPVALVSVGADRAHTLWTQGRFP